MPDDRTVTDRCNSEIILKKKEKKKKKKKKKDQRKTKNGPRRKMSFRMAMPPILPQASLLSVLETNKSRRGRVWAIRRVGQPLPLEGVAELINTFKWQWLSHPPYSPDPASATFVSRTDKRLARNKHETRAADCSCKIGTSAVGLLRLQREYKSSHEDSKSA